MSNDLTQTEADDLFQMEKLFVGDSSYAWPSLGTKLSIPLQSKDGREEFVFDVSTSSIKIAKLTLQNRCRVSVILARLDIDGPPHRNPDDTEIPCPHIHYFREGFADKWAHPLPEGAFTNLGDKSLLYKEFANLCKITNPPHLHAGLF